MTASRTEAVDLRSLPHLAPGYAYVTGVEVRGQTGVLRLRYAHGREVLASFGHVAEPPAEFDEPALAGRDPLSVVVHIGVELRCHAIARSGRGAQPVPITPRAAWACARRGVHTVLISGPDAGGEPA